MKVLARIVARQLGCFRVRRCRGSPGLARVAGADPHCGCVGESMAKMCRVCNGRGRTIGPKPGKCPACGGTGLPNFVDKPPDQPNPGNFSDRTARPRPWPVLGE